MNKILVGWICGMALLLLPMSSVLAQETAKDQTIMAAEILVKDLGVAARRILQQTQPETLQRNTAFAELMVGALDFDTLAKFSLGRYAGGASTEELTIYRQLFAIYFIDVAVGQIDATNATGFSIIGSSLLPNGDVIVKTRIDVESGKAFEPGWRVRVSDQDLRIVDVFIEGASASMHFRNRFENWLNAAGIPGMISKLEGMTKNSPHRDYIKTASFR